MSQGPYTEAKWVTELRIKANLCDKLLNVLSNHCGEYGESESALQTLERKLAELKASEHNFIIEHDLRVQAEARAEGEKVRADQNFDSYERVVRSQDALVSRVNHLQAELQSAQFRADSFGTQAVRAESDRMAAEARAAELERELVAHQDLHEAWMKKADADRERMDYLESEMSREQEWLLNGKSTPMPPSLFRSNSPITRAVIDAALARPAKGGQG